MADKNNASDRAKYNSLKSKKKNLKYQKSECENRIAENEYKIKRLKKAKKNVTELKTEYRNLKRNDNALKNRNATWKGSTLKKYKSEGEEVNTENGNYYKQGLDRVLDSLNNEITRLENENYNEKGFLGKIVSSINSLTNKIENFFN